MKNLTIFIISFLLIIFGLVMFISSLGGNLDEVKVVRVIDGDTIITENKQIIRILGIDAPERGEKGFQEAKQHLQNLVLYQYVDLVCQSERDKYNRKLCWVYLD